MKKLKVTTINGVPVKPYKLGHKASDKAAMDVIHQRLKKSNLSAHDLLEEIADIVRLTKREIYEVGEDN